MHQTLSQALSTQWIMFYNPAVPLNKLTPIQTLENSINFVNHSMVNYGKVFADWNSGAQDELARLMWVNWIYQRLSVEPIRKPVLCHLDQDQYKVDCGDTRLMALKLFDSCATIGVVITCNVNQASQFDSWQPIKHERELIAATGFLSDACVLVRSNQEHGLEWLEIGDRTTSHHLHNVDQRVAMMQRYVNNQSTEFMFNKEWVQSSVDWTQF